MKELFNIPNSITLSRLLGIPVILYLLNDPSVSNRWWSLGIFLVVALTDWLDGYLARKLDQVSDIDGVAGRRRRQTRDSGTPRIPA